MTVPPHPLPEPSGATSARRPAESAGRTLAPSPPLVSPPPGPGPAPPRLTPHPAPGPPLPPWREGGRAPPITVRPEFSPPSRSLSVVARRWSSCRSQRLSRAARASGASQAGSLGPELGALPAGGGAACGDPARPTLSLAHRACVGVTSVEVSRGFSGQRILSARGLHPLPQREVLCVTRAA